MDHDKSKVKSRGGFFSEDISKVVAAYFTVFGTRCLFSPFSFAPSNRSDNVM